MGDWVPPEFGSWSLAWAEEFNGPEGSPADPRTWRPETGGGGWGNAELQYYTSETANAALDGAGSLAITVARLDSRLAQDSGADGITASLDFGSPLAARFHVYSVCWEPDRVRWYVDQTLYHTVTPADLGGNRWVFDHEFYLLLNVAVGGRFSQPPDRSTVFPQIMLIDYTRVYMA